MFKRIASLFGTQPAAPARKPSRPSAYGNAGIDTIYDLLFCDQPGLFAPREGQEPNEWQRLLFGGGTDPQPLLALANDANAESRTRALAFGWLRERGHEVPTVLLGTIVEVPLEGGLDTLAAYVDGQVRYINQSGKLAVIDGGPPEIIAAVQDLLRAAQVIVDRIGPWDKPRLPPPQRGNIRMTFLVSDGLYFGEGPFDLMQRDPMAGPFIANAAQLLKLVVDTALADGKGDNRVPK
jgi:hypothetical protein